MAKLKAEQETGSKYDHLWFSAPQVGRVSGTGLTSTSSRISSETVMILPVAELREGGSTVRIGATLVMCSLHPFSCSVS